MSPGHQGGGHVGSPGSFIFLEIDRSKNAVSTRGPNREFVRVYPIVLKGQGKSKNFSLLASHRYGLACAGVAVYRTSDPRSS